MNERKRLEEIIADMAEVALHDFDPNCISISPSTLITYYEVDEESDWFEWDYYYDCGQKMDWQVFSDKFKRLAERIMKEMPVVMDWNWMSKDELEIAVEREVE